jgi:methylated-DNA-[protein]-cysteine S-methyltransferase
MDYTTHYQSPLGGITLASDGDALVGLWFDGQKYFADALAEQYQERDDLPVFDDTRRWLDIYFSGRAPGFTTRLLPRWRNCRSSSPKRPTALHTLRLTPTGRMC